MQKTSVSTSSTWCMARIFAIPRSTRWKSISSHASGGSRTGPAPDMAFMSRRLANALGFVVCAALLAYALYAEHVLGLAPCPLCIFQRVAVIVVGVLFLLAAL